MSQIVMGNFVDTHSKLKYSINHIIQIKSKISPVLKFFISLFLLQISLKLSKKENLMMNLKYVWANELYSDPYLKVLLLSIHHNTERQFRLDEAQPRKSKTRRLYKYGIDNRKQNMEESKIILFNHSKSLTVQWSGLGIPNSKIIAINL